MSDNHSEPTEQVHVTKSSTTKQKGKGRETRNGEVPPDPAITAALKSALSNTTALSPTVGARPTAEELRAAMGPQPAVENIGKLEDRYECREPLRSAEYFRAHHDRGLWQESVMLVDRDGFDRPVFLVSPGMQPILQKWLKRVLLVPCINVDGILFIWPIIIADILLGQRSTKVEQNKREIALQAVSLWTALVWFKNRHIGEPAEEKGVHLGEPAWPADLAVDLINTRAFGGNYINSREHEIAKIYLGLGRR
jgi:hypothetical protein